MQDFAFKSAKVLRRQCPGPPRREGNSSLPRSYAYEGRPGSAFFTWFTPPPIKLICYTAKIEILEKKSVRQHRRRSQMLGKVVYSAKKLPRKS